MPSQQLVRRSRTESASDCHSVVGQDSPQSCLDLHRSLDLPAWCLCPAWPSGSDSAHSPPSPFKETPSTKGFLYHAHLHLDFGIFSEFHCKKE